jgi:two-component system KDP operon response regulator KdpE
MATVPSILIVDDEPIIREVWTTTLTRAGYRVVPAGSGREALAVMRDVVPDLVVLDLRMPEMSGDEFLRALLGTSIPVLVVSSFVEDHARELRASRFNVVGVLDKLAGPAEFLRAVKTALASPPRQ